MHILQVSDGLAAELGGTAAACAQLASHLARRGVDVSVLTCEPTAGGPRWPLDPAVSDKRCQPTRPRRLGFCPDLPTIVAALPRPHVVHIHGLWRLHYLQAAWYARRLRVPVVVSVHGMLYDVALAKSAGLKRPARWLYQDRLLRSARCLHATAPEEADEIRRLGFDGPIAVVPWGVDMPDPHGHAAPVTGKGPGRVLMYFGRLHPRKRLDVLLDAWSQVYRRFDGWRLVIAGADPDGYRATLTTLASDLGVSGSISWFGPAAGAERERLFADADVVVLPSDYENFGLVVAEALARGVPVIATQGSPWASLASERCGWWIPTGVGPLAHALASAMGLTDTERLAMGDRGRLLARAHYSWNVAGAAMERLYAWVVGSGPEPEFVRRPAHRTEDLTVHRSDVRSLGGVKPN